MSEPGRDDGAEDVADEAVDDVEDLLTPDDDSAAGADMAADSDPAD